ncbi:hypothetical protein TWF481_002376 [Arthrobotrys musiformis]|uniref:deoxyribose-phosphate aldolase n=1 Tax=Arthrobotrys musiformis TaxID=47236 RepID=A0AAV9VT01_9PEZI
MPTSPPPPHNPPGFSPVIDSPSPSPPDSPPSAFPPLPDITVTVTAPVGSDCTPTDQNQRPNLYQLETPVLEYNPRGRYRHQAWHRRSYSQPPPVQSQFNYNYNQALVQSQYDYNYNQPLFQSQSDYNQAPIWSRSSYSEKAIKELDKEYKKELRRADREVQHHTVVSKSIRFPPIPRAGLEQIFTPLPPLPPPPHFVPLPLPPPPRPPPGLEAPPSPVLEPLSAPPSPPEFALSPEELEFYTLFAEEMQYAALETRSTEELTPLIDAHIQKILEDLKAEETYTPTIVEDLTKPTEKLAQTIDHTLLKPEATEEQIKALCEEAIEHGFKSCCINPSHVRLVSTTLVNTPQTVTCSVIGFPLGATTTASKCYEASLAIFDGAKEIDMVLPVGQFLQSDYSYVYNDIMSVVRSAKGIPVKVIIETSLLKTQEQKIAACWIAAEAGASWVKTSTGFNGGGASVEDVRLMRVAVAFKEGVKVKASGGVRNFEQAIEMVKAGASRIGTSNGVAIMGGKKAEGGAY